MTDDPFADLEALGGGTPPPAPTPKPAATAELPSPTPKPAEPPPTPKPAAAAAPKPPQTPKELREAFEAKATALTTAEKQLSELQSRLTKLEAQGGNTQRQEADLAAQIATKEARVKELEAKLEATSYETSKDYVGLDERYNSVLARANADMAQLLITDPNTGEQRAATPADFNRLWRLPHAAFFKEAKELFGEAAGVLVGHRDKLLDIQAQYNEGRQKWEKTSEQRRQEDTARQAQEKEFLERTFSRVNEDAVTRFPQFFGPDKDDPEGNDLLAKGYAFVDHYMNHREEMPLKDRVIADSKVRNRAAAFPRMAHRAKALAARVTELEAKLKEFEESTDLSDVRRQGKTEAAKSGKWEEDFEKLPG